MRGSLPRSSEYEALDSFRIARIEFEIGAVRRRFHAHSRSASFETCRYRLSPPPCRDRKRQRYRAERARAWTRRRRVWRAKCINRLDGRMRLGCIRAECVAGMVDIGKVQRNEVRPLCLGQFQPFHHLLHPFFIRNSSRRICKSKSDAYASYFRVAADQEERCRAHSLLFRQHP